VLLVLVLLMILGGVEIVKLGQRMWIQTTVRRVVEGLECRWVQRTEPLDGRRRSLLHVGRRWFSAALTAPGPSRFREVKITDELDGGNAGLLHYRKTMQEQID